MHTHGNETHERRLLVVLGLAVAYLLAEVIGGLLTGSLALLADSAHLLTDALGLGMAVAAIRFARRPATPGRTYGFYRTEILAALVNSIVLIAVAGWILFEAWQRLARPRAVDAFPMLLVAVGGLIVTLIGARLLHRSAKESLNVRGAFLEVVGDLLGAAGAIVAAVMILATGWTVADPIISAVIGLLIVPRAWALLRSVIDVLLESAPNHLDMQQIEAAMREVEGVASVHDLHVWTITSGFDAMSAHVQSNGRPTQEVLHDLRAMLHQRFGIEHMTLQVEALDHADDGACCILDPRCFVPRAVPGLAISEHSHTAPPA